MAGNQIVINVDIGETRVALIENGIVTELHIERRRTADVVGNVYLGKVTRVLPGMNAAFVDIGLDRAAFLHVDDALPERRVSHPPTPTTTRRRARRTSPPQSRPDDPDGDARREARRARAAAPVDRRANPASPGRRKASARSCARAKRSSCRSRRGPSAPRARASPRHISLPGRYVVYLPTVEHIGISKRIGSEKERARLREAIDSDEAREGRAHRAHALRGAHEEAAQDRRRLPRPPLGRDRQEARGRARPRRSLLRARRLVLKTVRDLRHRRGREDRHRRPRRVRAPRALRRACSCPTATTSSCTKGEEPSSTRTASRTRSAARSRARCRCVGRLPHHRPGRGAHRDRREHRALRRQGLDVSRRRSSRPTSRPSRDRLPAPLPQHRRAHHPRLDRHGAPAEPREGRAALASRRSEGQGQDHAQPHLRARAHRDDPQAHAGEPRPHALRAVLLLRRHRADLVAAHRRLRDPPADPPREGRPAGLRRSP
jgi:hypothetical protein